MSHMILSSLDVGGLFADPEPQLQQTGAEGRATPRIEQFNLEIALFSKTVVNFK